VRGPPALEQSGGPLLPAETERERQREDDAGQQDQERLAHDVAADRELLDAVRTVARGEVYVRPDAARILAKGYTRKDPLHEERTRFEKLTERERDVLRLTAQGFSAPEIGEKLFISPKTVDTYKQRIQDKLGLSHRHEYVQLALRLGLLTPES